MDSIKREYLKDQIKQRLGIKFIIEYYIGSKANCNGRYKCPFNHEEAKCNLEIRAKYWKCYSCGDSGDEIEFVRKLFGFKNADQAIEKIAVDFNLDSTIKVDNSYVENLVKMKKQREEEKQREIEQKRYITKIYNLVCKRQNYWLQVIKENKPYSKRNIERYKELNEPSLYIKAYKQMERNTLLLRVLNSDDLTPYESEMYGYAITREEKDQRAKEVANMIKSGIIKITMEGDCIYG